MTATDSRPVLVDLFEDEGYAIITFNRPEKRNALSEALLRALIHELDDLQFNDRIAVIVTKGAGDKAYCSGMDLHYLRDHRGPYQPWNNASLIWTAMQRLREHPKITIASVRGWCVGGGLALLAASDLAVVSETAQIGMPEIIRGSFGQYATTALFHSGIPLKKAFYIQLTGRNLTGVEAERIGLASVVVPDEQVDQTTLELARLIAGHNHRALEHGKLAAYMGLDTDFNNSAKLDWLAGARLRLFTDPLAHVSDYLGSQKGGTNVEYRSAYGVRRADRPDQQ